MATVFISKYKKKKFKSMYPPDTIGKDSNASPSKIEGKKKETAAVLNESRLNRYLLRSIQSFNKPRKAKIITNIPQMSCYVTVSGRLELTRRVSSLLWGCLFKGTIGLTLGIPKIGWTLGILKIGIGWTLGILKIGIGWTLGILKIGIGWTLGILKIGIGWTLGILKIGIGWTLGILKIGIGWTLGILKIGIGTNLTVLLSATALSLGLVRDPV